MSIHRRYTPILLLALVGCGPSPIFKVRTTVRPDGSVVRETYQSTKVNLPSEALKTDWIKHWKSVEPCNAPSGKELKAPLTLANAPYFTAKGEFADVSAIPAHYKVQNKDYPDLPPSELKTSLVRKDLVFAVEYVWSETITDVATPDRFEKGVVYLWDVNLKEELENFKKFAGDEYDISRLEAYWAGDGRKLAISLARDLYAIAETRRWDRPFSSESIRLAAEQEIDLPKLAAMLHSSSTFDGSKVFPPLVRAFLQRHIRTKDGEPITNADVDHIDRLSRNSSPKESATQPPSRTSAEASLSVFGHYGPLAFLFKGIPAFDFTTLLPGRVVETNGVIAGFNTVRWKFDSGMMYPVGYTMSARSFFVEEAVQKEAFGKVALDEPLVLVEYSELLQGDKSLLDAMRKVREKKSLAPLELVTSKDDAVLKNRDRLLNLLKDATANR